MCFLFIVGQPQSFFFRTLQDSQNKLPHKQRIRIHLSFILQFKILLKFNRTIKVSIFSKCAAVQFAYVEFTIS
ncbi:hypothetical protein DCC81_02875 [Chitinophaga parva]|uniref:Uncharacterized protein n=1 Tax=Chitinophaga parva TaxID=2169414 RepID=A0A2T7BL90_9BACT|nr:hypothetical protein DCC81_02875 [Chitinophaga parva]